MNNKSHMKHQEKQVKNIGIVVVAFGNESTISSLLGQLAMQKRSKDFIVLIDNHPKHASSEIAKKFSSIDQIIESENIGFARGCNLGVRHLPARIDTIFFLNPDTAIEKDTLNILRENMPNEWAACMPLLLLPDKKVNSTGNALHVSGLSWCKGFGSQKSEYTQPTEINVVSGACMLIRKKAWETVKGFEETYFMYYEDTDLSILLRLNGFKLGLLPSAKLVHDYDYQKGTHKWFYIERNRYLLILRTFPLTVILVLLPLLIIVEVGLWINSVLEKRFLLRIKSTLSFFYLLPLGLRQRKAIQKERIISASTFINLLEAKISTPILGKVRWLSAPIMTYHWLAVQIVRLLPDIKI